MKKTILSAIAIASFFSVQAQNKVVLSGTKFTYPLIETWITAYKKVNPEARIKLVDKNQEGAEQANVRIASYDIDKAELKENEVAIPVSRYALLPVANAKNPLAQKAQKRGIKQEDLKKVFLEDPEDALEDKKTEASYQVYTRSARVCSSITFANYLGAKPDDIVGKGITGEDKHLLEAIRRDSLGVTYNNLGYLYDLQSRALQQGLVVLPIDINDNGRLDKDEQIYQDLDVLISYLDKNPKIKAIPVEKVYFIANTTTENDELNRFVTWVQKEGQAFNQRLGFLNVGEISGNQRASIQGLKRDANK
ncbi:hypothetical protein [Flectobacillus major]|jgi:phosphate transport system substrate-binding protein|uniref:hypothetical protein n=1 Tax=Flectobacillus major TaxID=103 RepID=UPI0004175B10|nr:hypothetical protein [Flectobacillus major]